MSTQTTAADAPIQAHYARKATGLVREIPLFDMSMLNGAATGGPLGVLMFGVVGILDDIPHDKQMLDNEVLVPFEHDTMLTINSPIWVSGAKKVQPRKPPGVGEHSDEILRNAGYDEAAIARLRASGAVA